MDEIPDVTPEAFAPILRRAGFDLPPEEAERLRGAYNGLRRLLARIPAERDFLVEPAVLFAPSGSKLST